MSTPPPVRTYRSAHRAEQARRTRRRVLQAAGEAFVQRGYAGTTMRSIAGEAGVSVATVEQLFGTKAGLLKAAIDVAIAGDDEPVGVLDRGWTQSALEAADVATFLLAVSEVLGPAQHRSAGLVLAVFEAPATEAGLAAIAEQMIAQRSTTASWIVDAVAIRAPLRPGLTRSDAVDTAWLLMDPAVFQRLVRDRGWTLQRYQSWFAASLARLLTNDEPARPERNADEQHR